MKFNRLNDDKLQIIISRDDLIERDMKKWDLVPYNPGAQELVQEILEEAYHACGFEVGNDTQLMIEAYPMTGESLIVTITKVTGSAKGLFEFEDIDILEEHFLEEMFDQDSVSENEEVIYTFYELEDAIQLSKLIDINYTSTSNLYRCNNLYYLVFHNIVDLEEEYFCFLSEYGDIALFSVAYLLEHGQEIIAKNAVHTLAML